MGKRYKINEVAKILGISPSAIRFYEKKGLFAAVKDEDNGYRSFDENDLYKIWSITFHRNIDMSVSDIYRLKNTGTPSLTDIYNMVQHQKSDLLTLMEEQKRKLAIWEIYERMAMKAMRCGDPPRAAHTGDFHLFDKASFFDSNHSLFRVCNPCHIFGEEGTPGKADCEEYALVFTEDWNLVVAADRREELRVVTSFPALSMVECLRGDFDEQAVLAKALARAAATNYRVKGPYYVVYLISTGDWENPVRYYEIFLPLEKGS